MSAKLLIGPLLALLLAAGGAHAQTLQQAREQVDAGQYGRALPVYEALLREQPANTDLLIETARVYGFADRHPEAIAT
ncbi:MAG: hypothetical protein JSR84_01870, partial [Proteobacteria bacterium]|nr:hypothetical protein [Pseudomonadota bacterium]